jgi:hypothetical protein
MKPDERVRVRNMPVDWPRTPGCESGQQIARNGAGLRGANEDNPMRVALWFSAHSDAARFPLNGELPILGRRNM